MSSDFSDTQESERLLLRDEKYARQDNYAEDAEEKPASRCFLRTITLRTAALVLVLLHVLYTVLLVGFVVAFRRRYGEWKDPSLRLFSPASHVVEYEEVVFDAFKSPKTPYMGVPDDEVDAAWDDLYRWVGINQVDRDTARQLVNWTVPVPGDEGHYIVMLDVMHQLHCANIVRRGLHPPRYGPGMYHPNGTVNEANFGHIDHCMDSIRQYIMCHGDVSTHYWRWNEERGFTQPIHEATHTCRNFRKIHEWAEKNALTHFDLSVHAVDPLRQGMA